MSDRGHIEASLIYRDAHAPLGRVDEVALRAVLDGLGLQVHSVQRHKCGVVAFEGAAAQVLVIACDVPFPTDHFRGVMRPDSDDLETQRAVLAMLAAHGSSLTILVSDRTEGTPASMELKRSAAWEVLDHLMAATEADLVYWADDDRLLTPAEAEAAILEYDEWGATVAPRRPAPAAEADPWGWAHYPPASDMPPRDTDTPRDAGLSHRARAWMGTDAARWIRFDDAVWREFTRDFLDLGHSEEATRLSDTAVGRSSIFVMSATIAVFALPVGGAALVYNALSGGDARHTAHLMALTGLGLALSSMGVPMPVQALGL